jgi:hypothetical protein
VALLHKALSRHRLAVFHCAEPTLHAARVQHHALISWREALVDRLNTAEKCVNQIRAAKLLQKAELADVRASSLNDCCQHDTSPRRM